MTESRNPDRLIRAWLDLMPSEAPDRVVSAVLQTVEATPQLRDLRLIGQRRYQMNRLTLIAAVAAIGIAMLGGAALLTGAGPKPTSTVSSVPATPTGPTTAATNQELQGDWLGAEREIDGLPAGAGTHLLIDPDRIQVTASNRQEVPFLRASAS